LGFALRWQGRHLVGGRIARVFAVIFHSISHFTMTGLMIAMLPQQVPGRRGIVPGTGCIRYSWLGSEQSRSISDTCPY